MLIGLDAAQLLLMELIKEDVLSSTSGIYGPQTRVLTTSEQSASLPLDGSDSV